LLNLFKLQNFSRSVLVDNGCFHSLPPDIHG